MNWLRHRWNEYKRKRLRKASHRDSKSSRTKSFLLYPIQLLFIPLKAIDLFFDDGVTTSNGTKRRSRKSKIYRWIKRILWSPIFLIRWSFRSLSRWKQKNSWREVLYIVPAMAMILLIGFVIVTKFFRSEAITNLYAKRGNEQLQNKNFGLAKIYFQRLMSERELTEQQKFSWAFILHHRACLASR